MKVNTNNFSTTRYIATLPLCKGFATTSMTSSAYHKPITWKTIINPFQQMHGKIIDNSVINNVSSEGCKIYMCDAKSRQ